jgi:hypothetical protein
MHKILIVSFRVTGLANGLTVEREFDLELSENELQGGSPVISAKIAYEVECKLLEALPGLRAVAA